MTRLQSFLPSFHIVCIPSKQRDLVGLDKVVLLLRSAFKICFPQELFILFGGFNIIFEFFDLL